MRPALIRCEQRPKTIPPLPHRLVADVYARSNNKSSTLRSDSGKWRYSITPSRNTSEYRNRLAVFWGERGMALPYALGRNFATKCSSFDSAAAIGATVEQEATCSISQAATG